jgi:hypothetical protein
VIQQQKNCWERCFLCGPCRGYITRSSCDYDRVLRRQLEEYEVGVRCPPAWERVLRQSLASKVVNTEAEDATALEAVTRRQPVKIQQPEKT